ncbi:MAG TPA: MFS transporter [Gaiellaceae bacterium]
MRRIFVDVSPLRRFPDFRRLWTGYLFRQLGAQLTATTVVYQVFTLTHSNTDVGLVSLAQLGPALLAPIIGGAIADAIDRRILLVCTAVLFAFTTTGLALNASASHPALWPIYVCAALTWGLNGIDTPTRTAVTMGLVDRESILPANVLRQMLGQTSEVVGPGLAGALIAVFHGRVADVYWIDVASTIAALQAVLRLPALMPGGDARKFSVGSIAEGFRYLKGRQVLQGAIFSDLVALGLGAPNSLFPYMALVHFHGGPEAFGLISAGPAVGALAGSILSGWTHRVTRHGRWALISIATWGAFLIGFGLSPWLWLGVVCIAGSGWSDANLVLFRSTMLQLEVPDRLRGRISAINTMVGTSGPKLGSTDASLIASVSSAPIAIVSGGIACIIGAAVMARAWPKFAAYDVTSSQPPA